MFTKTCRIPPLLSKSCRETLRAEPKSKDLYFAKLFSERTNCKLYDKNSDILVYVCDPCTKRDQIVLRLRYSLSSKLFFGIIIIKSRMYFLSEYYRKGTHNDVYSYFYFMNMSIFCSCKDHLFVILNLCRHSRDKLVTKGNQRLGNDFMAETNTMVTSGWVVAIFERMVFNVVFLYSILSG